MTPHLFSPDMEAVLLEQYENMSVMVRKLTLRAPEKYALIATRISDVSKTKAGRWSLIQM